MTLCCSSGVPAHFPSLYFAFRSLHVNILLKTLPIQDCETVSSAPKCSCMDTKSVTYQEAECDDTPPDFLIYSRETLKQLAVQSEK